jgi:hypothetical protein
MFDLGDYAHAMRYALAISLLLLPLAGCYKRVVATHGLGATGVRTQPSYRSDTAADRAADSLVGRSKQKPLTEYDPIKYDEKR